MNYKVPGTNARAMRQYRSNSVQGRRSFITDTRDAVQDDFAADNEEDY